MRPLTLKGFEDFFKKPIVFDAPLFRTSISTINSTLNVYPPFKLLSGATIAIADASTGGKASQYLADGRPVNSTLSLVPGGELAQLISNRSTHNQSGKTLTQDKNSDPKGNLMNIINGKKTQSTTITPPPPPPAVKQPLFLTPTTATSVPVQNTIDGNQNKKVNVVYIPPPTVSTLKGIDTLKKTDASTNVVLPIFSSLPVAVETKKTSIYTPMVTDIVPSKTGTTLGVVPGYVAPVEVKEGATKDYFYYYVGGILVVVVGLAIVNNK